MGRHFSKVRGAVTKSPLKQKGQGPRTPGPRFRRLCQAYYNTYCCFISKSAICTGLPLSFLNWAYVLEVCGSSISATRPVPVLGDAYPYPYPTRAENCYPTRPEGIPVPVAYTCRIAITRYNRPSGLPPWLGPLHCISSDESIFCSGEHVLHASS